MRHAMRPSIKHFLVYPVIILSLVVAFFPVSPAHVSAAACTAPSTDYGTVTSSATSQISIPATGTYRVWSRIQIPSSAANSYLLEIDGTSCYTVGGNTAMATNTWTWVDYQGGNTASKINATLSAGNHSYKLIGNAEGVLLDRIIFTQDTSGSNCNPPPGTGDNCANPPNVAPTIGLSASPTSGTAPLTTTLTATPADSDGTVASVEFFRNGTSLGTAKTSAPWTLTQTGLAAGTYSYTAKVTDNSGVSTTSSAVTVTVTGTATPKAGDVNNDGAVNSGDLAVLSFNWLKTGMTRAQGDLSGDGTVNSADLATLSFNWLK